ncbi:MAG: glycosyltransferase family 4 protein [Paludibacteraceae bacterium]|nr:glycosyltransferase family 4 protein [Paludibacteraceae bacterium]
MPPRIKVNILSPGRFHVCDLARELNKLGFDVKFYSFVPTQRSETFGLPRDCSASLFWILAPFVFMEKKAWFGKERWTDVRRWIQDLFTSWTMREADVTIAMSGEFNRSMKKAKRDGAIIICERGSKHIIDQKRILDSNPSIRVSQITQTNVNRELTSYELADYIAVGAKHVETSFLKRGFPKDRLFLNPYGVDLKDFHPMDNVSKEFDFIMVGTWSYQKGCDLIVDAIRKTNYTLLHVGALGDLSFPLDSQYQHISPVDQKELYKYYAKAKVFVLPSRQDGLAMVLVQAVACHLPIIASPDGGACDLKEIVANPDCISIIEDFSAEALIVKMEEMLAFYDLLPNRDYAGDALNELSWEAYGNRYAEFLHKITNR